MTGKVETVFGDGEVSLKVSGLGAEEAADVLDRLNQLKGMVQSVIDSDGVVANLPDVEYASKLQACQAIVLRYQFAIEAAKQQAMLIGAVAQGTEKIEDHGFPEFSNA